MNMRKRSEKRLLPREFCPGIATVVCGRGTCNTGSSGNKRLKTIVSKHLKEYSEAKNKGQKTSIVSVILNAIKEGSPEGAFVRLVDGAWWEVEDAAAREKIGCTLRDCLHTQYRSSTRAKLAKKRKERELKKRRGGTRMSDLFGTNRGSSNNLYKNVNPSSSSVALHQGGSMLSVQSHGTNSEVGSSHSVNSATNNGSVCGGICGEAQPPLSNGGFSNAVFPQDTMSTNCGFTLQKYENNSCMMDLSLKHMNSSSISSPSLRQVLSNNLVLGGILDTKTQLHGSLFPKVFDILNDEALPAADLPDDIDLTGIFDD